MICNPELPIGSLKLFLPQHHDGIHAGRPARGSVTGDEAYQADE